MKGIILGFLFLFAYSCSKTNVRVHSVDKESLRKRNKVAVLSVDFGTKASESYSFSEGFIYMLFSTNPITDFERERGVQSHHDRYKLAMNKIEEEAHGSLSSLEDRLINRMNMYLLSKKLVPLERSEIVKILKESSLYQTGLFDNAKNLQIGKLATADMIMLNRFEIKLIGVYSRKCEIRLTSKLISVDDGAILAIGEVFMEEELLSEAVLHKAIEKWFDKIDDDSWLFFLNRQVSVFQ
ncbi:hypothetical protein EHQ27_03085 [Leptospira wolffii]|uniref:Curli production assembly/transport component CsgG domain protein n=1 Tax=Leptospira wolffii TaxID=409998 RepID=A0A2M9ZA57_9LEPT|nr:hypothetical protein [Leptospira wolffii]PJZ65264.1 hypothetical protein CH371_12735 [Leptospira wolffii]TGK64856.1 hypothetical protein EHQ32_01155 [Leptospira wolffii]TGK76745.1 hypothetical protein EHQ35_00060 [Leptospira wolffii]TGK77403.1 hypothetical protein EHQ27_03085 [Leptospira wolffii]TGL26798.1 hypothetical protein EHQ57_18990 [Leptospira wolffii]